MEERFEDRYTDVLQNIEFAIVSVVREHADVADSNIDRAIDGLIRTYTAEASARSAPTLPLGEYDRKIFDRVRQMCEWRLGRGDGLETEKGTVRPEPKTMEEIIACLKRIRKSVRFWNNKNGRKGYVNFIVQYVE